MSHASACSLVVLALAAVLNGAGPGQPSDAPPQRAGPPTTCDLVFGGGRVVDGTGAPWFRADVCVAGDRIAFVGALPRGLEVRRRIDASRLVVAPGFIDMLGQSEYNVLVDPRAASKITQGITTEITGEGASIAPLSPRMIADREATYRRYGVTPDWTTLTGYWRAFERARPAINLGTFVGAGGVRELVLGLDDRPATSQELRAMEAAVAQAMEEGSLGLSTSLIYVPSRYATTEEIVALARVAARYGGSYITHMRSEEGRIDEALDEAFRVGREAALPVDIYHLKTAGRANWGRMPAVLRRIEEARAAGVDVAANQYPWTASSNNLDASLPAWVREGGRDRLVARLKDPATRARARTDFPGENPDWEDDGPARILIIRVLSPELKRYEGRTIAEIARERGIDPIEALMDLVVADNANVGRVSFTMSEDDVRTALRHPLVAMCTDSGAVAEDGIFSEQKSHPRAWGSATRILGTYVREERLLSLEEAIRKMTSLPAARVGLLDRGILRPGFMADVVAFDPETVGARSSYRDPLHYSEGVPYVAVNGELVVDAGKITAARPGRPIKGRGRRLRMGGA
jgi:dihydroorotase/N-acyl-D-amino-acid deacylase